MSYSIESYRILSYPIVSYPIVSCRIESYRILSYPILSYRILSYPFLSYPFLAYPIVSFSCGWRGVCSLRAAGVSVCDTPPRISSYLLVSPRIVSHVIVSPRIVSYPILSYPIVSNRILSYRILLYPILSYPIVSFPSLSYPIVSYRILLCPIVSNPIESYRTLSYPILSCPVVSNPIVSYRILSYRILSYPFLWVQGCLQSASGGRERLRPESCAASGCQPKGHAIELELDIIFVIAFHSWLFTVDLVILSFMILAHSWLSSLWSSWARYELHESLNWIFILHELVCSWLTSSLFTVDGALHLLKFALWWGYYVDAVLDELSRSFPQDRLQESLLR